MIEYYSEIFKYINQNKKMKIFKWIQYSYRSDRQPLKNKKQKKTSLYIYKVLLRERKLNKITPYLSNHSILGVLNFFYIYLWVCIGLNYNGSCAICCCFFNCLSVTKQWFAHFWIASFPKHSRSNSG